MVARYMGQDLDVQATRTLLLSGLLQSQQLKDAERSFWACASCYRFHFDLQLLPRDLIGVPELRVLLVRHLLVCMVETLCDSAIIPNLVLPNTNVTIN